MHAHARLNAKAAGKLLFYIPSIDTPSTRLSREEFDDMRGHANIGESAKFPGILALYVGMLMILTDSYLPPRIVRGAEVEVVDIELHPHERPLHQETSVTSHGCVVLHYMPKCIYVRLRNCTDVFLAPTTQLDDVDLRGLLAVKPTSRAWTWKGAKRDKAVSVTRTQIPLLPQKQCTLHGVQGKTAEPGFIAHFSFPKNLSKESIWLAYYVSLSRPRSFATLLCHTLPARSIIEGGPPESITNALDELFKKKIKDTKRACIKARATMGWPTRP